MNDGSKRAKVESGSRLTSDAVSAAIHAAEANRGAAVLSARVIYIQPDLKRPNPGAPPE